MSIFTNFELNELAHESIKDTIAELAHDQMGLSELLSTKFGDRFDETSETDQAVVIERFREAIKAKRLSWD